MSKIDSRSRRDFVKTAAVAGGAATLGACASTSTESSTTATHRYTPSFYPKHNERTKGWMRFIWQKATTPDDWGYSEYMERPWGINIARG